MINIVIPMAGAGSRFVKAGYSKPKPFINVGGLIMIERVLANLQTADSRFILIGREEHLIAEKSSTDRLRQRYNCEFISIDMLTAGAACTVLLSCEFINNDNPLLIANSDQLVEIDINTYIHDSKQRNLDGSILTFYAKDPKWSYAKIDVHGFVTEVREKIPISPHATVGLYYYQRGKDFVNSAVEMIVHNDRTNNEFYIAPVYNYAIGKGLKIGIHEIAESKMFGLGTPEDLEIYLNHINCSKIEK